MTIMTDTVAAQIIVEPTTGDIDLIVEQPVVIVDAPATVPVIVEVVGGKGPKGDKGDPGEDSTVPGPPGPTAVSADAGNTATLGSDSLLYVAVPPIPDEVAVILDGVGAPTSGIGVDGDYYLDGAGHVLYGPKGAAQIGGPTYSPPPISAVYDGVGGFNSGIKFQVSVPGAVTKVQMNLSNANNGAMLDGWRVQLWDAGTGALLYRWDLPRITFPVGSWQTVALPAAWKVEVGKTYCLSLWNPVGSNRSYCPDYNGYTAGPLTLLADGVSGPNGVYSESTPDVIPPSAWPRYVPPCWPVFQGYDASLTWPTAVVGYKQEVTDAIYANLTGDNFTGPVQVINADSAKESLSVWGAAGQTVPLQSWRDVGGVVKMSITPTAFTCSIAGTFSGYLTMGTGVQNNQPTAANHLTRKDYVDSRIWKGTQAAYDAIGTKDPTVLYVVAG